VTDPRRLELSVKLGLALAEAGELGRADALLAERIEAGRRDKSLLVYRDGEGRERILELEEGRRTTIGRRADNDLALPWDREVSRHHAALEGDERGWSLVEPGLSRNGSYVNGRRVVGRQALGDGDVLRFGATVVVFRGPAAEAPPIAESEQSGLTALASSAIRSVELTVSERELLATLERTRTPETHEPGQADLGLPPDDVGRALQSLARRFAADGLPPEEQVPVILARARAIGLLG
jgi:pSer/pThr/pTyr-binding forkhead associated (FHA) protein